MARIAPIMPLAVSYTWGESEGTEFVPESAASSTDSRWPAGSPVVREAGAGEVKVAPLDATSGAVLNTAGIVGFTSEVLMTKRITEAVDGFSQKTVVGNLALPGIIIEANLYVDGAGGSDETIEQADLFSSASIRYIDSKGEFVIDDTDTTVSAVKVTIIAFKDQIGTVNGRVLALLASGDILPNAVTGEGEVE